MVSLYIAFGLYLIGMIFVGLAFSKKSSNLNEYLIGGRSIGSWVTAFSAQASDMSGWLLMGLPGAIYLAGFGEVWTAIGLAIGTFLNWYFVAPRLRVYTGKCKDLTLSSFFSNRFRDSSGFLRLFSAIVVLYFFTVYAASGMVASGKLFNTMYNIDYKLAVLIGACVILFYTMMGGYLAVCWTDLFQGALMFLALVIVPIISLMNMPNDLQTILTKRELTLSFFPGGVSMKTIVPAVSCLVWGLGYFGQPHILSRFMSVKNIKILPRTITIAMTWVIISLFAAVVIGVISISFFVPVLGNGEEEKVFILLIQRLFPGWIAGFLLAAILAAIISTIDSQLLVATSILTSDFYYRFFRREAKNDELVKVSRFFVLLISIIAMLLALFPSDTIFGIVKFAWGGFGAAFGPVVLMSLYSRKTSSISAITGMVVGTIVMLAWYFTGLGKVMYEILPGFVANFLAIMIMNQIVPQKNEEILAEFDEVVAATREKRLLDSDTSSASQ